ncbi:25-hydroxycholesterol 7-alpha-hydroxylase [Lachnellula occidentalis]|uniref:25-hydroxycholesterol 7-alpha-hydroxylase n=1 Tax=Lachnellula occidentalis TaxID=215460 RepID=A0A8H8UIF2_9HELO|nr:25-hydroxycholesterol 7-alpha-hydroxylase [Lachnellula occidentalis]
MEDDFHEPLTAHDSRPPFSIWQSILTRLTPNIILALFLGPILIVFLTRYLSERSLGNDDGKKARRVWMPPYWIPFVGHGIDFPGSVMSQKESVVQFRPMARTDYNKFFGIPKSSKAKYDKCWDELNSLFGYFMKDPQLGDVLKRSNSLLEQTIPQMISFVDSEIDLQPWERYASARYISNNETEIYLCAMMRDVMGHTSVSAMFGSALMEAYPDLLHDTYSFDKGMYYLLAGLPWFTPWPPAIMAHMARSNLWAALDDQQRALDALAEGKPVGYSWGQLDDVSEFIMKRNEVYRKHNFEIKERGELSVLWPLIINSSLLVYWQLLYILADPELADKIRAEVAPYAIVEQGESIGKISEAPKLKLDHESLSKRCPHLRSTYLEALRLTSKPWSVRKVASDVTISQDKMSDAAASYMLHKGEYITLPHELHMTDPKYFQDPDKFEPERFLVTKEDGTLSTDAGTIRPYGGGPSMCKGRIFAERECLAAVAGVLMFWDIKAVDKKAGWVIPKQLKMSAVSKPAQDTRVRIKRRVFDWEKDTIL